MSEKTTTVDPKKVPEGFEVRAGRSPQQWFRGQQYDLNNLTPDVAARLADDPGCKFIWRKGKDPKSKEAVAAAKAAEKEAAVKGK